MSLDGKRIILTGGATGIGRATAIRVASEGAQVAFFDVNDADAESTLATITDVGGEARYWHVDVVEEAAVQSGVDEAVEWLGGGVDVLLSIAGVLQGAQISIDEFPTDMWDFVLDINLKGTFLVVKHVTRHMIPAGAGTIIITSSGAGVLGGSSSYAYGSSKGGTHGLAMVLDRQLSDHGIRVNDVLPGSLDTPLKRAQVAAVRDASGDEESYERMMANLASPDGVASVMAFLASDEADYVRGSIRTI
ncbi:MAG: SDR family oxidoreductase [Chloroflexi bacterium]|nr:SDR family oxidoreductase [Chloroflexota bacterium]